MCREASRSLAQARAKCAVQVRSLPALLALVVCACIPTPAQLLRASRWSAAARTQVG